MVDYHQQRDELILKQHLFSRINYISQILQYPGKDRYF